MKRESNSPTEKGEIIDNITTGKTEVTDYFAMRSRKNSFDKIKRDNMTTSKAEVTLYIRKQNF